VATARLLLLCPFACCTPLFSEEIGAITSPTEGYLSDGTQRGNGVRNICRLAKKKWKIIPNSAIEPGPARWRHNCGQIISEKPAASQVAALNSHTCPQLTHIKRLAVANRSLSRRERNAKNRVVVRLGGVCIGRAAAGHSLDRFAFERSGDDTDYLEFLFCLATVRLVPELGGAFCSIQGLSDPDFGNRD
jgi:hypothetical protein